MQFQTNHLFVAYSQPNGWTDWTEIFCGHSWLAGGVSVLGQKNVHIFSIFLIKTKNSRATPGPLSSITYYIRL